MGSVGTDIVSVARIAALVDRRGSAFTQRWFTAGEIAYCAGKAFPSRHFAARLAAKEAVVKALPFHWDGPVPWRMIEIVNGQHGAPAVRLSGAILAEAQRAGVGDIAISLSHCDEYATAIAMVGSSAEREERSGAEHRSSGAHVAAKRVAVVAARAQVEQVLAEWSATRDPDADPELEAVRLAMVFEDVFDATLTDADIDLAVLCDPDAMVRVLSRRPWREGTPD